MIRRQRDHLVQAKVIHMMMTMLHQVQVREEKDIMIRRQRAHQ